MSAYTSYSGRFIPVGGSCRFTASQALTWDIGFLGSGVSISVPPNFVHDVSVPAVFTPIFPRTDPRFQRAARLHDWLCILGWSAWSATAVFYDALAADGVPPLKRWAMALAVLGWMSRKS